MAREVSLSVLRSFVRVVERGSISAAARDLGITQPTATRQLKELETTYESTLLIRTTRALRLTDAGRLVYEAARQILRTDAAVRDELHGAAAEVEGRLHITAPSGFGSYVVAPFCSRFVEQHARATLDLRLTDRHLDLIGEGIDMAVRIGRLPDSSLFAQPLAQLEEVMVAHPRIISRPIRRPADLSGLPWVRFSGLKSGSEVRLERRGKVQKVPVKPRLATDQIVAHREAILAGAGAGLIHRYAVDSDIRAGRLVQLLPEWSLPLWTVHCVSPVRALPYRLRRWRDELREHLRSLPGIVPIA